MTELCIFMSYEETDRAFATQLMTDLQKAGVEIITDSTDASELLLTEKLSHCQQFVVIQTPAALRSPRMQMVEGVS